MASHILFITSVNCGFQLMGCEQVNLNLTPLSFVNLSGFKPQALTILLKLSTSQLFGLSHKLAYGFLTSLNVTHHNVKFFWENIAPKTDRGDGLHAHIS